MLVKTQCEYKQIHMKHVWDDVGFDARHIMWTYRQEHEDQVGVEVKHRILLACPSS